MDLHGLTKCRHGQAMVPDPFFDLPNDPEWNACIGRQGTAQNYVDGYIEAAIELASAVIEKKLYGQRDTLAMPILYNARHGLELALKLAINSLHGMGAIADTHPKDHNIRSHWELLDEAKIGDVKLRGLIAALQPYVDSLAKIDDDGQELRYAETRAGDRSLDDKALANIEVMHASVVKLGRIMEALKYRVTDLGAERTTGTLTAELSRTDLLAVADRMPSIDRWREPVFDEVKAELMAEFGLSGKKFAAAIDAIKSSRETRRRIGQNTDLKHLSDAHTLLAIEQWARCHPKAPEGEGLGLVWAERRNLDAMAKRGDVRKDVIEVIRNTLSLDEVVDLDAVYQVGRNNEFAEHYDRIFEMERRRLRLEEGDPWEAIHYLITKTNLQTGVARGLFNLGRPDLATQVEAILRPAA